eukprot:jgi/Bigna1/128552/aug1.7_g3260
MGSVYILLLILTCWPTAFATKTLYSSVVPSRIDTTAVKSSFLTTNMYSMYRLLTRSSLGNHEKKKNRHGSNFRGTTTMKAVDEWVVLGIDPDVNGALAVLHKNTSSICDSPSVKVKVGKTFRKRLDPEALADLLRPFGYDADLNNKTIAFLEAARPHQMNGKQGWYASGYAFGIWRGALAATGVRTVLVEPNRWKHDLGLSGKDKTQSRELACEKFPDETKNLSRVKDHGRAEALLIALWGTGTICNLESEI